MINRYILFAIILAVSTFVGQYGNNSKDGNYLLELYAYKELYFLVLHIIVVVIFTYKLYLLVRNSFLKTYMDIFYRNLLELTVLAFFIFALFITVKLFAIYLWTTIFLLEVAPVIQDAGLPINFDDVLIAFMKPGSQDLSTEASKGDIPPMGDHIVTAGFTPKGEPYACANVKRMINDVLKPGAIQTASKAGKYYWGLQDVECVTFDRPTETSSSGVKKN